MKKQEKHRGGEEMKSGNDRVVEKMAIFDFEWQIFFKKELISNSPYARLRLNLSIFLPI